MARRGTQRRDSRAATSRRFAGLAGGTAVLAIVAAGLSGCSGDNHIKAEVPTATTTSPSVVASSSPSGTTPGPTSDVSRQAMDAYTHFWESLTPASRAKPTDRRSILAPYTADPELGSLLAAMARQDQEGKVFYGQDAPRPAVTMLSVDRGIAVVTDCMDSSHSGVADSKSGRKLTVGVARNSVVSTLHLGPDGQWRVAFVTHPKAAC